MASGMSGIPGAQTGNLVAQLAALFFELAHAILELCMTTHGIVELVPSTRVDHLDTTVAATLLPVAQIAVGQHLLDQRKEYLRVAGLVR